MIEKFGVGLRCPLAVVYMAPQRVTRGFSAYLGLIRNLI
jgi:hypothetical protein